MAKQMLTAGGIAKMKAGRVRREIHDAGAPGLHLIIQTSGAKSFAMRFRRPGGARAKLTLGPFNPEAQASEPRIGAPLTLAAARALAAQINMDRAGGADVVDKRRIEKQCSRAAMLGADKFGQAARDFLASHTVRKTGQKPRRWRETASLLGLRYLADGSEPTIIEGGLCDRWQDRPVASITADDIHDAIQRARRGQNGTRSESMGRRMADALSTMFGWLLQDRRLKVNPSLGIYRPPPPPARHRVLSDVELRQLWQACDALGVFPGQNSQPPWSAFIKLLVLTGARLREIAHLHESELTDDSSTICLPPNRTKNGLPFDLPVSPLAREVLAGVQRIPGCQYIFSTNGRTPISGFSKLKKRLDRLIAERNDGTPLPAWRLHDLRRVVSTRMNDLGILPHVVEAALNHVSGAKAGVAGVYNKSQYGPEKRTAFMQWANHVQGIVS